MRQPRRPTLSPLSATVTETLRPRKPAQKLAPTVHGTGSQLDEVILDLNNIVIRFDSNSALTGLTKLAEAFGMLLDTYAGPNDNNPAGMSDDPAEMKLYFCEIIMSQSSAAVGKHKQPKPKP